MFRKTIYGTCVQFGTSDIQWKNTGNSASVYRVLDSIPAPLIPLPPAFDRRRKRRLGPSISLSIKDDSPRYRWVNGEWERR